MIDNEQFGDFIKKLKRKIPSLKDRYKLIMYSHVKLAPRGLESIQNDIKKKFY